MLRLTALLSAALVVGPQAAWAGHEVDNTRGKLNGTYKCDMKVKAKDKEDAVFKDVKITLVERYVDIFVPGAEVAVHARIDQIYTFGFKSEVSSHDPEKGTRYICTINGQLGD